MINEIRHAVRTLLKSRAFTAAAALVITVVSLASCLWPALRASRVDPMEALRSE